MGPLTAVARAERTAYEASPFAMYAQRYTAGVASVCSTACRHRFRSSTRLARSRPSPSLWTSG
jgi:hypothetical protein